MPQDLSFYYAAIPAVILVGLAKGGMGDALSLIGLPFLALVVAPVEAAAILLPILVFMDMISLAIWRQHGDWTTLKIMLPGAILGITFGWATSALVPGSVLRVLIGAVTVAFCLRYFWNNFGPGKGIVIPPRPQRPVLASLWDSNDLVTRALMQEFYAKLYAGAPAADALHQAKLRLIERYGDQAAPVLWAGFVLTGGNVQINR